MHKKEIWLALDSRGIGGIETHVLNLARGLHERGQFVRVIFLNDYGPHPLYEAVRREGVAVEKISSGVSGFFSLLKNHRPWVLHTHGYKAGIVGRFWGALLGIPVVSTFHAGEPGIGRIRLYNFLDRLTAWLSTPIAVSESIARALPVPARVLNNFVSVPKENELSSVSDIAFVGRLSYEKGPDYFLKIACRFPEKTFHVYGDGDLRGRLENEHVSNVIFHGAVTDTECIWRNVGLLCVSSRHEGLPMAALEAMARGVPVAAFSVGALPNVIQDGVNGLLAEPGNLDSLCFKLRRWMDMSPEARKELGRQARLSVKIKYSTETVVPVILDIYQLARRAI